MGGPPPPICTISITERQQRATVSERETHLATTGFSSESSHMRRRSHELQLSMFSTSSSSKMCSGHRYVSVRGCHFDLPCKENSSGSFGPLEKRNTRNRPVIDLMTRNAEFPSCARTRT